MGFEQGVRPARFVACGAHGHEITELSHVPTRFQDGEWRDRRARNFDHIALAEPVIPPDGLHLGAKPATDRSEIVEPFGTPMDLKGRKDDATTAQHTGQTFQPLHGGLRLHHDASLLLKPFNPSAKFGAWAGLKRSERALRPWDRPWWASPIRPAQVATCASPSVPSKPCCPWRKILLNAAIQNVLWSWLKPHAWAACRASVPVQPVHCTKLRFLPATKHHRCSTHRRPPPRPPSSVGDAVASAGLERAHGRRVYILKMAEATPRAS